MTSDNKSYTIKMKTRNYKKEYATFQSKPKQKKYRAELNGEARKRGIYGKRKSMGVDLSHTKSGKITLEKTRTNRARNGQNGKSTKK